MGVLDQPLSRGIVFGFIGGLAGTVSMDIVIVVTFLIAGMPGDTFFDMVGEKFGGGPEIGIALHILIGVTVGLLFALTVLNVSALKIETMRKGLILGVAAGAITIPLGCIPLAIWLGEPIAEVVAFSAIPHLVYGTILGWVVSYGLLSQMSAPRASESP